MMKFISQMSVLEEINSLNTDWKDFLLKYEKELKIIIQGSRKREQYMVNI